MARVTVFEGGNVALQGATDARIRPANFSASPLGEGLQAAGGAVSQYVEQQTKLNDIHDEAATKEAATAVNAFWAENAFTGENAYFNSAGRAALDNRPDLEKSLDEHIKSVRQGLKTPRQQQMFDDAMTPQRMTWGVQISRHAEKETKTWAVGEAAARAGLSGEEAKRTYFVDPQEGENHIVTGLAEISARGELEGWGEERVRAERLSYESATRRDIGEALAYAGPEGPMLAEKFVEAYSGAMTADDRDHVLTSARVVTNQQLAEQRRAEAEARRVEREARSDAKDRANSVYRNIQDGVPVDAATLAGAISDAKTADDPALVEGLRQGGLKNDLTMQYAGASPVEIQERVNQLSAEIASEGSKVQPDKIVERDHLQTLLGRANTAVSNDPLSWGAAALRIDPGRLDLNSGDSINRRIQVARQVARRTGGQIRVMTNEEAATFGPIVANGSVAQKSRLAVSLSRFGALADDAARQVAPNNAGFHNLVGIAGHPNSAVGMTRVSQILAGQEVLKSSPKIVDKNAAMRMFGDQTGQAFKFLPSVRNGVLDNAYALLAADANERGATEWPEAMGDKGSRWYAAFNSALGAYTKDGRQYGGLAKFNGGVTIVPEEMAVSEFEARIARARAAEFGKAQNGMPEYANGIVPSAAELRKLQWVPASDGVYRLSDGASFLMKRGGGFYEVDVRKLK
jgi:hypothetical protein